MRAPVPGAAAAPTELPLQEAGRTRPSGPLSHERRCRVLPHRAQVEARGVRPPLDDPPLRPRPAMGGGLFGVVGVSLLFPSAPPPPRPAETREGPVLPKRINKAAPSTPLCAKPQASEKTLSFHSPS